MTTLAHGPWTWFGNVLLNACAEARLVTPHPILLQTLYIQRTVKHIEKDSQNKQTYIYCKMHQGNPYNPRMNFVGEFKFAANTGQVAGIHLEAPYRNRDLEAQILIYMMKDMQDHGASCIWEVASCHQGIYSNLWDFKYKPHNIHSTETERGYSMEIPQDIRSLVVPLGVGKY